MSDERDNTNERLEGLLRRWGAQEAAGRSAPGAFVPGQPGQTRPRANWLWRWAPAIAAAVLLAAAAGLHLAGQEKRSQRPAAPSPAPAAVQTPSAATGEIAGLKGELARQAAALQESARSLSEKDKALAEAALAVEAGKSQLAQADKHLAEVQGALADATAEAAALKARLEAGQTEKAKIEDQLKQARAAGDATAAKLKRVQQALVDETAQLRQMHAEALAGESKAKAELQRGRASQAMVLAAARKAYMDAMAPGRPGAGRVEAMQTAARTRRMLDRRPEALEIPRAGKLRDTVNLLEDVFTRLDLVDASNPAECRKFMDVLRDKHVSEQVEQALALTESEAIRGWLVEASLILGGGDNAG